MKKLILLFSLFTLTVSAQETETPYSFPVPEGWGKEKFNSAVTKSVRIIPSSQMEGFFVAKMIKKS